jgi:hypothetical protein
VCAAHTTEQLQRVTDVITKVGLELGIIADRSVRIAAAE